MKFFCFDYIARVYLAQPKLSKETTQMSGKSQVTQLRGLTKKSHVVENKEGYKETYTTDYRMDYRITHGKC